MIEGRLGGVKPAHSWSRARLVTARVAGTSVRACTQRHYHGASVGRESVLGRVFQDVIIFCCTSMNDGRL